MYDNHSLSSSGAMAAPTLVVATGAAGCACGALDAWSPRDSASAAAADAAIGREIMNESSVWGIRRRTGRCLRLRRTSGGSQLVHIDPARDRRQHREADLLVEAPRGDTAVEVYARHPGRFRARCDPREHRGAMTLAAAGGIGDQVVDEHALAARQGVPRPASREHDERSDGESADQLVTVALLAPDFRQERVRLHAIAQDGQ